MREEVREVKEGRKMEERRRHLKVKSYKRDAKIERWEKRGGNNVLNKAK